MTKKPMVPHSTTSFLSDGSRCQMFIPLTSRRKRNYKQCNRNNVSTPSATGCTANWQASLLTSRRTRLPSSLRQYENTSRNVTFSQQSYWRHQPFGTWSSDTGHVVPSVLKDHTAFTFRVTVQDENVILLWLLSPEEEDITILQNIRNYLPCDATLHSRRLPS